MNRIKILIIASSIFLSTSMVFGQVNETTSDTSVQDKLQTTKETLIDLNKRIEALRTQLFQAEQENLVLQGYYKALLDISAESHVNSTPLTPKD